MYASLRDAIELSTPSLGITKLKEALTFMSVKLTFNSLSRDHASYLDPQFAEGEHAFNSLSRDHGTSSRSSTISSAPGGFQLPLSGSLGGKNCYYILSAG